MIALQTCPLASAADDDAWHERLVSYYSRFGFRPVRVVRGDSLGDLPHMLVWGGAGTVRWGGRGKLW